MVECDGLWRNTESGTGRREKTTKEEKEKYYVKNEKTVILPFCGAVIVAVRFPNTKNANFKCLKVY
jgi:hypothetical protein